MSTPDRRAGGAGVTTRPRVWAPFATTVLLDRAGVTSPMAPIGRGWFEAADEVSDDYRFRLDGGAARPDPRSRWQPEGPDGPTRPFAADAHSWGDADFVPTPLAEAVLYEAHIGTFSEAGTFLGAIEHLDHLVELGVTHLELLPINTFAGRHGWGYDGVALFAPHAAYGDPDDLQQLVDECHRRGLAVVLDVVYNHLGPEGNHLSAFGPYFTDVYRTPWGDAVNLDGPGSDEVRQFFIDNAISWLRDYHIDGLRLDAMHAIVDRSATHWLRALRAAVDEHVTASGRPAVLIAEHDGNDPMLVDPVDRGGHGMDAMWNDDLHHAVHVALTGQRTSYYADFDGLEDVADALVNGYVYRGQYSPFRDRRHGRELVHRDGAALIGYLQNHDQVGNRARGDRIGHEVGAARQRAGAALVLLAPHVPMVFQGEEWATSAPFPYFADHRDPDLADAVRRGRQREFAPFGWRPEDILDPEDEATFRAAKLPWDELDGADNQTTLRWYRALLLLRRDHPALRSHAFTEVTAELVGTGPTLVVARGSLRIAVHLGAEPVSIASADLAAVGVDAAVGSTTRDALLVLHSARPGDTVQLDADGLTLPPDGTAIIDLGSR